MAFWNKNKQRINQLEQQINNIQSNSTKVKRFISEIGVTGTSNWSGYFQTDYNSEWNNNKYTIIPKMVNDAMIAGLLLAVKLPISQATVSIEPASDKRIDRKIADAVHKELFNNPTFQWSYIQDHVLEFFEYGVSVFEKIPWFSKEDGHWHFKLSPRLQETLERWYLDENGQLDYIEQHSMKAGSYMYFKLPADKLVMITRNQHGSNYQGESILRACYFDWVSKELTSKNMTLTCQRWGLKTPVIELPEIEKDGDLAAAQAVGRTYTSHQTNYIVIPFGFKVSSFGDTGNMPDLSKAISHFDKQMALRFLAGHIVTGMDGVGSYALSKDKTDFFLLAEESYSNTIENFFNERVEGRAIIKDFVDWNFSGVTEYPKLYYSKIQAIDYEKLARTLDLLAGKNFLAPTEEIREMLLRELDLPEEQTIIDPFAGLVPQVKTEKPQNKEIEEPGKETEEPGKATDSGCGHVHLADYGRFEFRRELTDSEKKLSNIPDIRDEMNDFKVEAEGIGLKWKGIFINELMKKAKVLFDIKNLTEFQAALNQIELDAKKLVGELSKTGTQSFRVAGKRVTRELKNQGIKLQEPEDITDETTVENEGLNVINPLVSILAGTLTGKLLNEFKKEVTRQKIASEISLGTLETLLTGLSTGDFSNASSEYIVTVYGAGREYEALQHADQIEYILRSEILDNNICKACKPIDLKEVYSDDPLWNKISSGPYTECEGGNKCRGLNLYVTKE